MTNKTYIKNTALLFTAMAVTKIVGALFKIPLANILGGTGMGYFSTAYNLYSPVFALTAAGVPTVIMRLTAKNIALGRRANALHMKKTCIMLFSVVGAIGMMMIWAFSSFFAENIACSPLSIASINSIAPAVFFCCIGAVIRGYYEGRSNVIPSVTANITEAVTRAAIGLVLSYSVIAYARSCFENGTEFMSETYITYDEVYTAALPWASAAAILAVTLSEFAGLIALIIADRKKTEDFINDNFFVERRIHIAKNVMKELFPIAAFALVMNCFSFVDLLTVTRTLDSTIHHSPEYFERAYTQAFSDGITAESLANFMYGSYTGIAMSLFMLIPSFAGMTEKTSIPDITASWEKKDTEKLKNKISELIRASSLIGFPACFGAFALSRPILTTLYPDRQAEVSVCIGAFSTLCIGGIFMILASALFGVFQAIGKGHIPLWIMIGAIAIKAILNSSLLKIPELSITGAAIATVSSYLIAMTISVIVLKNIVKGTKILTPIIIPFISAASCAISAALVYEIASQTLGCVLSLVLAILSGGLVYILLLILVMRFRQLL